MSALSVADVLERAADLIEPEGKWTQFHYARTKDGLPCSYDERKARCFCAMGAIGKVAGDHTLDVRAAKVLGADLPVPNCAASLAPNVVVEIAAISAWNDAPERIQSEVVAKLREAAALARSREQVS